MGATAGGAVGKSLADMSFTQAAVHWPGAVVRAAARHLALGRHDGHRTGERALRRGGGALLLPAGDTHYRGGRAAGGARGSSTRAARRWPTPCLAGSWRASRRTSACASSCATSSTNRLNPFAWYCIAAGVLWPSATSPRKRSACCPTDAGGPARAGRMEQGQRAQSARAVSDGGLDTGGWQRERIVDALRRGWSRRAGSSRWPTGAASSHGIRALPPPELVRTVEGNGPERAAPGRALDSSAAARALMASTWPATAGRS